MKHVHHDLIVQWAKDTTQVVEELVGPNDWRKIDFPKWWPDLEYRIRHKHQDLIDQKAARPELIVEMKFYSMGTFEWVVTNHPLWMEDKEYRLVEPEKKKVKMWKWLVKFDAGQYFTTHKFYKSEAEAAADQGVRYEVIQRADWTEIEVDE